MVDFVKAEAQGAEGDGFVAEGGRAYLGYPEAQPSQFAVQGFEDEIGAAGEAADDDNDLGVEGQHEGSRAYGEVADVAAYRGRGVSVAGAGRGEDPGGLVVGADGVRCARAVLKVGRCGEPTHGTQRTDLAGRAAVAAAQGAVEDEAGTGAHAGEQEDDVVGVLGDAVPAFGDRREFAVVLHPNGARVALVLRAANPLAGGVPLRFANADQDRTLTGWLTLGSVIMS